MRTSEGREVFYVEQRTGGPTLDVLGPYDFEERGIPRVAGGFLGHYPTFWNSTTGSNEVVPVNLKAFYRLLLKYIKRTAGKTNAGKRIYWIGLSTAARIRDHLVALPDSWNLPLDVQPTQEQ